LRSRYSEQFEVNDNVKPHLKPVTSLATHSSWVIHSPKLSSAEIGTLSQLSSHLLAQTKLPTKTVMLVPTKKLLVTECMTDWIWYYIWVIVTKKCVHSKILMHTGKLIDGIGWSINEGTQRLQTHLKIIQNIFFTLWINSMIKHFPFLYSTKICIILCISEMQTMYPGCYDYMIFRIQR
jgi:hypothetical protein